MKLSKQLLFYGGLGYLADNHFLGLNSIISKITRQEHNSPSIVRSKLPDFDMVDVEGGILFANMPEKFAVHVGLSPIL